MRRGPVWALALLLSARAADPAAARPCAPGSHPMNRVELYFGAGRVTALAWAAFLRGVVTPRFPDGLTSYEAQGRWRGPDGATAERTRVVVIFYRPDRGSDARIDAIRAIYKARFRQRSVLRADGTACVGV